jgi:hypothetical protein
MAGRARACEPTKNRVARGDRESAFAFWAALPRERRRYAPVAEQFGVSPRTVERWARDGGWKLRLRAIEAAAARKADDELGNRRSKQLASFQQLIEDSSLEYARQLASGKVRITAAEFVGLIKVALLLQGAPAARVEVVSASSEWAELRGRILEALVDHPEARLALAEALEQTGENDDEPRR